MINYLSYDPSGNRVSKVVEKLDEAKQSPTRDHYFYLRDAQGNLMALYRCSYIETLVSGNLKITERYIYGSSRLGYYSDATDVDPYEAELTYTARPTSVTIKETGEGMRSAII